MLIRTAPRDALINASNDVTEALRRTIGLMQGELERSVLSSQMLGTSAVHATYFPSLTVARAIVG